MSKLTIAHVSSKNFLVQTRQHQMQRQLTRHSQPNSNKHLIPSKRSNSSSSKAAHPILLHLLTHKRRVNHNHHHSRHPSNRLPHRQQQPLHQNPPQHHRLRVHRSNRQQFPCRQFLLHRQHQPRVRLLSQHQRRKLSRSRQLQHDQHQPQNHRAFSSKKHHVHRFRCKVTPLMMTLKILQKLKIKLRQPKASVY